MLPAEAITALVKAFPKTLFAIDEAYMAFADQEESVVSCREENLLVLRSVTKDYALAGLRLGYAVGDARVIESVQRVCPACLPRSRLLFLSGC